jgi:hypothetical protein
LRVLPQHLLFGREFFNIRWQDAVLFAPFAAMIALWFLPRFRGRWMIQGILVLAAAAVGFYVACSSQTVVGFFAASPAMLLAFAGARPIGLRKWRVVYRAGPIAFCSLVSIVFALLVFATSPVMGGVQFGPRFFLPLYLPATLMAARAMEVVWPRKESAQSLVFVGGLVLIICSFGMGLRGMIFVHQQKAISGRVKDEIVNKIEQVRQEVDPDCRVLISNMQILALTAPLYFEHKEFFASDRNTMSRLERSLSRSGEKTFILVTRTVRPVGPVGITVAAPGAPKVPVMKAGEVVVRPYRLAPAEK